MVYIIQRCANEKRKSITMPFLHCHLVSSSTKPNQLSACGLGFSDPSPRWTAELLNHFLCQDESSKMMLLHISNTRLQNPRASLPAKHGRSSDCCPSAEVDACNMSVALGRSHWLWLYTLSQLHTWRVNIKPYVDQWSVFFSHDRTKRSCFRQILQEVSELDLNSPCLKISYCRTGAAAHDFERTRQTLWNMAQQFNVFASLVLTGVRLTQKNLINDQLEHDYDTFRVKYRKYRNHKLSPMEYKHT